MPNRGRRFSTSTDRSSEASGGWIAVGDLVRLLRTLDIDEASSRSAVSRMKRAELLQPAIREGAKGYTLTAPAEEWFADGDQRILHRSGPVEQTRWVLASFSVPEDERMVRYRIRARLGALGFGQAAGGLMVAPVAVMAETERTLRREASTPTSLSGTRATWDSPAQRPWWRPPGPAGDPSGVRRLHGITEARAGSARFRDPRRPGGVPPLRRQRQRLARLPYLDPGLPLSALPARWPSSEAAQLFKAVAARLRPGAWRWFVVSAPRITA